MNKITFVSQYNFLKFFNPIVTKGLMFVVQYFFCCLLGSRSNIWATQFDRPKIASNMAVKVICFVVSFRGKYQFVHLANGGGAREYHFQMICWNFKYLFYQFPLMADFATLQPSFTIESWVYIWVKFQIIFSTWNMKINLKIPHFTHTLEKGNNFGYI